MASPSSGLWWRYAIRHNFLTLALILSIFGPVMGIVARGVQGEDRRYIREGTRVEASVTGKERYRTRSNWTNTVSYRYRTDGGLTFEGRGTIPDGPWALLPEEGGSLPIEYLASEPSKSRPAVVASTQRYAMGYLVLWFAAVFTLIGVVGLVLSLRGVSRRVHLLRTGERTSAEITEVIRQYGVIVYRYVDGAGREHAGRLQAPRGIGDAREPGDTFVVVVDPRRPQRHEIDLFGVRARA